MRAVSLAVVGRDLDFQIGRALDHVLIGYDVASGIDNESGAETLQGLPDLARTSTVVAEKLCVKVFDRVANTAADYPLGVDIDDRRQNFGHGPHCRSSSRG